MKEINLPDVREAAQVEDQLRLAVYEASMYYRPTKITCGHRTVYLIDQGTYERLVAKPAEPEPWNPDLSGDMCRCGQTVTLVAVAAPGEDRFRPHNDAAGDPCPGLPLPFPPTVQEADR